MLPPIMISKADSVTAKVGETLVVSTPNVTISTNNPKVLELSQAHSDGSASFNPGAKVISAGQADLVVTGGVTNTALYTVKVTAVPA